MKKSDSSSSWWVLLLLLYTIWLKSKSRHRASKQASKQIDIELRIQNANDVVNLALRKRKKVCPEIAFFPPPFNDALFFSPSSSSLLPQNFS